MRFFELIFTILVFTNFLTFSFAGNYINKQNIPINNRPKRGGSAYPVFGSGGHGEQNNYLFTSDPFPFANYLGGGNSGRGSYPPPSPPPPSYGSQPSSSSNMYSLTLQPVQILGPSSSYLDNNYLNQFSLSSHSNQNQQQQQYSQRRSDSSPGMYQSSMPWNSPPTSPPASGGYFVPYFGLITPNFANYPSSSNNNFSSPGGNRHPSPAPNLSASVLAQSAHRSFQAQNELNNQLIATPSSLYGGGGGGGGNSGYKGY